MNRPPIHLSNDLMTKERIEQYWEEGYTVIPDVFVEAEIDQLKRSMNQWKFMGQMLQRTWRKGNTIIWVDGKKDILNHLDPEDAKRFRDELATVQPTVRGMQWPSYHDKVMDSVRTDPRMLMILEPLIGNNIKQIINQLHWKKPGSKITWPLHRDVRSRRPAKDFLDLYTSWVQTGIAVDPHMKENGAMYLVPGSHKDVEHDPEDQTIWNVQGAYQDDPRLKPMEMNPGDVGLWSAYTVHGGGFNTCKGLDRRLYINGFVKAENCMRGEWAFKEGRTCYLHGQQAKVQFEDIEKIIHGFYPADHGINEVIRD
ncbi:MAG: phytanoyl-CoA dioxygenase family protein [Lentisphaeria bacterium]|nr:phytanoyl-CoA dioxygenase family protein [Lentisphaeria bacterium]